MFSLVIEQKTDDLQAVESYGTELVNNAENKIVKLQSELKAKESAIGDLQLGGTGNAYFLSVHERNKMKQLQFIRLL